nr:imidazole glycerol phosphate synthase subunit HisF-like [Nerophis lumbriciformis]
MAAQIDIPIQSGGGIRDEEDLQRLFDAGVGRAVIGSLAVKQPELVSEWLSRHGGDRICLAMDVKRSDSGQFMLATTGWTDTSNKDLWSGLDAYAGSALRHVLCTDISRDGTLVGPNQDLYRECVKRLPQLEIQASGGVKDLADVTELTATGVSSVIIGKAILDALERPGLINELVAEFGSQCVVVGIDSIEADAGYQVKQYTGDPDKMIDSQRQTMGWVTEVQERGAGEVVLNCMNQDGMRNGYDVAQLALVRAQCSVPLIASGGAGEREHFKQVFELADVDGALAATVFHSGKISIPELKQWLAEDGVRVRQ